MIFALITARADAFRARYATTSIHTGRLRSFVKVMAKEDI